MLTIAILISTLSHRIRRQVEMSRAREHHTEVLYRLGRKLTSIAGTYQLVTAAQAELSESFASEVSVFLPDESRQLRRACGGPDDPGATEREIAGTGTDTLPEANAIYVPLTVGSGAVGVLALRSADPARFTAPDQRQLLRMAADQLAMSIERDRLAEHAQKVLQQKGT
jgi:two-component system sensor histidine kinase KdpD